MLGVLRGVDNGIGITGIVPRSVIGFSAVMVFRFPPPRFVYDLPDAINRARAAMQVGDVIIIEQQISGPTGSATCSTSCDCCSTCMPGQTSQFGFIPVEWEQATFDAIRNVTASGRIVVEAGGNGQMNLGDTRYNRAFDRTFRDSGAIIVGAGTSLTRAPMCFTSAGDRIDVQGWGQNVVTLGYGDRWMGAAGETQWYTRRFGGNSSASPIVTGAAAAVQGVRRERGLQLLNATQMRALLRTTGTAQATGRPIGPLPNLREAITLYVNPGHFGVNLGTPAEPYRTLPDALGAAWDNAHIKMMRGNYTVPSGVISQPVTLRLWLSGGIVTITR